jgi:N-acetylmuramoyl-L-alanine amidase
MGSWMTKHAPSLLLIASLIAFAGCQEQPVVEQLPAANFNGPIVQAPPVVSEPPKAAEPKFVAPEPKKAAPQLAGIPREWTPGARANDWRWIVIHHSATPAGGAKAFDKMHKQKGWDELGYHFVVGNGTDTGDGQVEVGPRWPKQKWGAHAKTSDNRFNNYGIGICLVGNFDNERPTRAQMQSLSRLVAFLMKTYHVPADRVIGHGDTKATDCPGRNLHIADVRRMATQLAQGDMAPEAVAKTASSGEMLVDLSRK